MRQLLVIATRTAHFVYVVGRRFYADRCLTDASALAYATLLSIVPLLALIFAILKGLGAHELLEPMLLSRFALDPQVSSEVIGYINNTNVSTLGFIGAAALVVTVISLLGSIEAAFNHIWRVAESRTLVRKVSDYLSVVFLTPILLLAAAAITSSLQFQYVMRLLLETEVVGDIMLGGIRLLPLLINAIAIGILYAILPNRKASPVALLLAALVAGASWQLVQATYLAQQIGLARYSAIYGALAQLPFTLVWLYVSWVVILAGAQVAAVYEFGSDTVEWGGAVSEAAVALQILLRVADSFERGGGPVDLRQLGREIQVRPEVMQDVAAAMQAEGWIAGTEGDQQAFLLSRPPQQIHLGVLGLGRQGAVPARCDAEVHQILGEVASLQQDVWERRDLKALRRDTPGSAEGNDER